MAASELMGFVASALVLLTFAVKDMRILRLTGLLSNVAFIIYAGLNCLLPVLLLHMLLLPINGYRLLELAREKKEERVRHAQRALTLRSSWQARNGPLPPGQGSHTSRK